MLLSVQNISKIFGDKTVLDDVSLEIRQGDRIALVGPNGAGKSTLLKILTNELQADSGSVFVSPRARIGYVQQHVHFPQGSTIWSEACRAIGELTQLVARAEELAEQLAGVLEDNERAALLEQYDRLQSELLRQDAYNWEHRVRRVLMGMGFPESTYEVPLEQLSGGQRNRLMLACVMISQPDLLILDEPSNHLDVETTEWLEEALATGSSAVLVVSHDRFFLDRVANQVVELVHNQVDTFRGNYTAYVRQKAERLEVQRKTFERQQAEIAKLEDFVRRNHYGQKSTQAEDRRKKLDRIERVDQPREIHVPKFQFPPATRTGDIVLRCENAGKVFGELKLFQRLNLQIIRGERWAILGSNGVGKTTLLRCLLEKEPLDSGTIYQGSGVRIGYFDQLLSGLDLDSTPIEALRMPHKERVDLERRNILATFGIVGDLALKPLRTLSGGERNRTLLAMLAASDANLLVLDEPTNHLDLWSREALEKAIREFDGTVLLVTHDRYLVNAVADHVVVMRSGRTSIIDGNYDSYRNWIQAGNVVEERGQAWSTQGSVGSNRAGGTATKPNADSSNKTNGSDRRNSSSDPSTNASQATPTKRKRKYPYKKVEVLEKEIAEAEQSLEEMMQQSLDPNVLRDGPRIKQLHAEIANVQLKIEQLYEHYEEAVELN